MVQIRTAFYFSGQAAGRREQRHNGEEVGEADHVAPSGVEDLQSNGRVSIAGI